MVWEVRAHYEFIHQLTGTCVCKEFLQLARSPHDPQRIRVASVFEFSVCFLSVCSLFVGKFSNFFVQYKAAGVRKNVVRMNTDVLI